VGSIRFRNGITLSVLLLVAAPAVALETDQFSVPPAPLADVSAQFQQHLRVTLQEAASRVNIGYLQHRHAAATAIFPWSRKSHAEEADRLQTEDAIAEAFYNATGPGLVECDMEIWLRTATFPGGTHLFDPAIGDSIYGSNPLARPITLQTLSPTVNLFGVYLGTDKVGHFIGQGWEYYQAFRKSERAGEDVPTSLRKAIEVGVFEEKTYFGLLTVGVYSNADLAANYAGLKFFLNLTRPVLVNGHRLPPIFVKRQDLWELNPELPHDFLKPYVTDHLNESLNVSFYSDQLQETVRANFSARAARWATFYQLNRATEPARLRTMTTFDGEPYGHSGTAGITTALQMMLTEHPTVAQHTILLQGSAVAR
jgi:hypothetical protein